MQVARPGSDVEQEVEDVAVLDHVVLAFRTLLAGLLGTLLALVGDEVIEADRLGADEAPLEIGVDDARRLWRSVALVDGQARTSFTPAVK